METKKIQLDASSEPYLFTAQALVGGASVKFSNPPPPYDLKWNSPKFQHSESNQLFLYYLHFRY